MRALQIVRHGPPVEALEVVEIERPEPGPGVVRIRVAAACFNSSDVHACYGRQRSVNRPLPVTLGMDACGVVDAAGEGAETWIGQRVVAVTLQAIGGIAEYALAQAGGVYEAPAGLDDAEAAAFLLTFHTAHVALFRRGRLEKGETLLVHGGAGSVGSAAIQLGRVAGARVIATAGGEAKAKRCRELGADVVIDHTEDDFVERVYKETDGVGVDIACDLVGGDITESTWRCVRREGRYVMAGFAGDVDNGFAGRPLRPIATGNIDVIGVLASFIDGLPVAIRKAGFNPFPRALGDEVHAELLRWLAEERIRPFVGQRVSLDQAAAALSRQEARETLGRTVVEIVPPA
jgi:NADPH2:quinone reductase